MRKAGWGRIVNVSSIYGIIGGKGEVAYSTAKAGIIGLTKSVAKECGQDAEPEEVARVIAFLSSDEASFITGIALPVSGGWGI